MEIAPRRLARNGELERTGLARRRRKKKRRVEENEQNRRKKKKRRRRRRKKTRGVRACVRASERASGRAQGKLSKRIHVLRGEATVAGGTLTDSEPG